MYWCVRGIDHVLVCEGYRSCIGVGGVSIMYWCVRGIDHVLVCEGYPSCIGV
jgi:ferredoxin